MGKHLYSACLLATASARTLSAVYFRPPAGAPDQVQAIHSKGTIKVLLPKMNLSTPVKIPAGDLVLRIILKASAARFKPSDHVAADPNHFTRRRTPITTDLVGGRSPATTRRTRSRPALMGCPRSLSKSNSELPDQTPLDKIPLLLAQAQHHKHRPRTPPVKRFFLATLLAVLLGGATVLGTDVPAEAWAKLPPHPRLFADAARFESLKKQTDAVSLQLLDLLKFESDKKLGLKPVTYPQTGYIMGEMRDVQGRILGLSLSYRLTGEKRYFTKAREELLTLAALPEWRPSHFLDTGEAALAAGVGFDWLYDDLSPDDRDQVAQAIVRNAILPSLEVEPGRKSWLNGDFNWTQVCHGGVVVAALAIAEREPELARKVTERAIQNFDKVGATYAPDGSYAEGPGYWAYGTGFHVILIDALRTSLGSGCGLDRFPGFMKTSDYAIQMMAPGGSDYNYSDQADGTSCEDPIMLWFARELRNRNLLRDKLTAITRNHAIAIKGEQPSGQAKYTNHRHLPFEIIWWDPTLVSGNDTRALHWTAAGVLPLAVIRSAWDDPNASFIAIKGGTPNHSHAHMDVGSFILEADGVRWAVDSGTEDYGMMRKGNFELWDYTQNSGRWTTTRVGPDGHNILRFDNALQNVDGKAEITKLPDENGSMGNLVELTPLYQDQVSHVQRRVRLNPDRSITIADEWTTGETTVQVSWQWLTLAQVTVTADGAILKQQGKTLQLRITEGQGARIEVEDVSKPRSVFDSPNPGLSRIVIRLETPAQTSASLVIVADPEGRTTQKDPPSDQ